MSLINIRFTCISSEAIEEEEEEEEEEEDEEAYGECGVTDSIVT